MPVYVGDYLRDTQELTAEEHGVYFLLLIHYWQKRGDIGADTARLSVVTRSSPEKTEFILDRFFELKKGRYTSKRADEELHNANARSEAARANARKRWDNDSDAIAMPRQCDGNAAGYAESMPNGCSSPSSSHSPIPTESKEKEPPITPPQGRRPNPVKYDFIEDQDWKAVFTEWGQNKKNPYRKQIGAQKGFAYLLNLSGGDIETARRIVDHSLANNWAGLFIPDDLKAKAEGQKSDERLNRLIDGI